MSIAISMTETSSLTLITAKYLNICAHQHNSCRYATFQCSCLLHKNVCLQIMQCLLFKIQINSHACLQTPAHTSHSFTSFSLMIIIYYHYVYNMSMHDTDNQDVSDYFCFCGLVGCNSNSN